MKTGDLVRKFGVSEATIRRWASTFAEFLSEGEGRHRNFLAEDVVVIATIYKLSSEGYTQDLIQKRLKEGFRVEAEVIDEIGYPDGRMVPAAVVEQVIDSTEVRLQLERVAAERDKLLELLESAQSEMKTLREQTEVLRREKETHIEALQREIKELQRALGKAEGKLEEIYENRKPKPSD